MAQSGHTETICYLSAFGQQRTYMLTVASTASVVNDPKRTSARSKSRIAADPCQVCYLIG
jgi:hypothetical protein